MEVPALPRVPGQVVGGLEREGTGDTGEGFGHGFDANPPPVGGRPVPEVRLRAPGVPVGWMAMDATPEGDVHPISPAPSGPFPGPGPSVPTPGWSRTCTTVIGPTRPRSRTPGGSSSPTTGPPAARWRHRPHRRRPLRAGPGDHATGRCARGHRHPRRGGPVVPGSGCFAERPGGRLRLVPAADDADRAVPLRGAAGRIVANMEASLGVPTATSVRAVPAKLLEVNRTIVNNQLFRTIGGKVSFTHLIGYAVVKGLMAVPAMNAAFVADADGKGTPGVIRHRHVGLGLAVDVEKSDGSRTLLVPCIRDADTLDFRGFVSAYEDLVRKIHTNKIAPDDFAGTTVTLTNPGTLGTVQSVPRLMPGQGLIVGVGALGVPAGFEAADPRTLAELGIGKTVTITSTYDHRIIQGAESGLFLAHVSECLMGGHGFYDEVFDSLEIPYEPVRWEKDANASDEEGEGAHLRLIKQVHVQTLINMYRVRGHLIAHLDPLDAEPPDAPPRARPAALRPDHLGPAPPLRGRRTGRQGPGHPRRDPPRPARRLLPDPGRGVHAHPGSRAEAVDPAAPRRRLPTLAPDEQRHILGRLNAAEVFERFLHSRYVGQKRFGLEGAESAIVLLDTILDEAVHRGAARVGHGHVPPGSAQRAGQHRGQVLRRDLRGVRGQPRSRVGAGLGRREVPQGCGGHVRRPQRWDHPGDHGLQPLPPRGGRPGGGGHGPGQAGRRSAASGERGPSSRTGPASPSRCSRSSSTATPPSPARAWWPRPSTSPDSPATGPAGRSTSSSTTSWASPPRPRRPARRCTPPTWPRWSRRPIFHVNGDDPEACARAARLAFGFRQAFHKDVVIDMVCYRRHGHNEGDDPSYTQPLMYALIEAKRSVRKLYTESLVRRGDISLEEAEQALDDFSARLQAALDETRAEAESTRSRPRRCPPTWCPTCGSRRSRPGSTPRYSAGWPPWSARSPRASSSTPSWPASSSSGTRWWPTGRSTGLWARRWPSGRCCWRGPTSGSPARTPVGAPSPSATPCWSTTPPARNTCRWPAWPGGRFTIRDSLLSEYACVGLRVRLLGRGARRPGGVGGPVRRLLERRRDHRRQLPGGGRGQVGPEVGPRPAAAPRLRGSGSRALVGPDRALPDAVRPGQPAGDRAHHGGPVLPPAPVPGQGRRSASR